MRYILIILILTSCGTAKHSLPDDYFNMDSFTFINLIEGFKIELIEFHPMTSLCHTYGGIPYSLLIGETTNSDLPKTLSVLSKCDSNIYEVGKYYSITPINNPLANSNMSYATLAKDTVIAGRRKAWLLGSEFPAVWGTPAETDLKN